MMPSLNLKPTQDYYSALAQTTQQMSLLHEGAIAPHFANLLRACASRVGWTLQEQFQLPRKGQKPLYKLGNRSALDWVIDQYQISTDARSGITNDPNNPDDETYILRLIKQVITVSMETVEIVKGLPRLEIVGSEQFG